MVTLDDLLFNFPGYALLSSGVRSAAEAASLVPDADGHLPSEAGYTTTIDPYYAALLLVPQMAAQPHVRTVSSEGSSVTQTDPDWKLLMQSFRQQSQICNALGQTTIGHIDVPLGAQAHPTDMSGEGDYRYGDIDTDME